MAKLLCGTGKCNKVIDVSISDQNLKHKCTNCNTIVVDSLNGIYPLIFSSFPLQNLISNSKYMNPLIEWGQWDMKQI